ncbi:hypothetical protein FRC17_007399 [Serendipita sp. 399]|nr:hypothetical protein FRC17_007399 [Serendipita sp. 399]
MDIDTRQPEATSSVGHLNSNQSPYSSGKSHSREGGRNLAIPKNDPFMDAPKPDPATQYQGAFNHAPQEPDLQQTAWTKKPQGEEKAVEKKTNSLYDELNTIRKTMRTEIVRVKEIHSALPQQEAQMGRQRDSVKYFEDQITRLKKERDEVLSPPLADTSAIYPGAADLIAEEIEQNKQRIDGQIERWRGLMNKANAESNTASASLASNKAEFDATWEALLAHNAMRKQLIKSLNVIEAPVLPPLGPSVPGNGVAISRGFSGEIEWIESELQDMTRKESYESGGRLRKGARSPKGYTSPNQSIHYSSEA